MLGSHQRAHTNAAANKTMAKWLKRSVGLTVVVLTSLYLLACCSLLYSGGSTSSIVPRFLRSPTEQEEKAEIRAELGHGTWNMLHRLAATFDKEPTPERQREAAEFFRLFGKFYPCEWCAKHFREMLDEHPIQTANNRELSLWLCKLHNIVNERLNKPQFPCTLDALKERWGNCGCFDPPANSSSVTIAKAPAAAPAAAAAPFKLRSQMGGK